MYPGISAVRSCPRPYANGGAFNVRGDEAIPTQPVHEAARE